MGPAAFGRPVRLAPLLLLALLAPAAGPIQSRSANLLPDAWGAPDVELPAPASLPAVGWVMVGSAVKDEPLYRLLAREASAGLGARIVDDGAPPPPGGGVVVGNRSVNSYGTPSGNLSPDGFRVDVEPAGNIRIAGGGPRGDAYGLFWLLEQYRLQKPLPAQRVREPAFPDRYLDAAGVLYQAGKPIRGWWDSYWVEQVDLSQPPYADRAHLNASLERFRNYSRDVLALGYNGVVIGDLWLHLVDFDGLPGPPVYPADSPFRQRHALYREWFQELLAIARGHHLKVVVGTDMPAFTLPLRELTGSPSADNPRMWEAYRAGMEELFRDFPEVGGLLVRIGEGGHAYAIPGYDSAVAFRTPESIRRLVSELLPAAEAHGKRLVLRTWTIGIGSAGDLHNNPATYREVLGDFTSPALVASVKHVRGDFFQYHELNPTLGLPGPAQMVEFQAKREFEGLSAYPSYVGEFHQLAMQNARDRGARAVWTWAQIGGWGGPPILYRQSGFWLWTDANVYSLGRLAWDPDEPIVNITLDWAALRFGRERAANATKLLLLSDDAVRQGLYLRDFARNITTIVSPVGRSSYVPPLLWVWWETPVGAVPALAVPYSAVRESIDAHVREGREAVRTAGEMRLLARGLGPEAEGSIDYEASVLALLADYRALWLHFLRFSETGDGNHLGAALDFRDTYLRARESHLEASARTGVAPLNLEEADRLVAQAAATPATLRFLAGLVAAGGAVLALWAARTRFLARGWLLLVGLHLSIAALLPCGFTYLGECGRGLPVGLFAGAAILAGFGPFLLLRPPAERTPAAVAGYLLPWIGAGMALAALASLSGPHGLLVRAVLYDGFSLLLGLLLLGAAGMSGLWLLFRARREGRSWAVSGLVAASSWLVLPVAVLLPLASAGITRSVFFLDSIFHLLPTASRRGSSFENWVPVDLAPVAAAMVAAEAALLLLLLWRRGERPSSPRL